MDFLNEKSVITKLRVSGEKLDAVSTRLYFERLFANTNIAPAGLPAKSIVCIRHLIDPAPQFLDLNQNASRFSGSWQRAVAREIEKLYRRAVRPINEIVPAQAESVVFTDKAELLACLASDWCRGILYRNWWWRSLFPNLESAQAVARIWLESAEYVPTAMNILAQKKTAVDFVRKLQPEESAALLKQIIETFGLKKIQSALFEPLTLKEKNAYKKLVEKEILSKKISIGFSHSPDVLRKYVPETKFQILTYEKEILLVIGLLLARAPRVVRSEKFARQIREYRIEKKLLPVEIFKQIETITQPILKTKILEAEIEKKSIVRKKKKSRKDFSEPKIETGTSAEKEPKIIFQDVETVERKTGKALKIPHGIKSEKQTEKAERPKKIHSEKSKTEIVFEFEKPEKRTKIYQTKDEEFPSVFPADSDEEGETKAFETVVRTKYGGVFYLLNLGLFLNIYRDFSQPLGEEIDLNIWDFAALLSRKILGKKIEKDEIWNLLKRFAGREMTEKFGEDFNPPDEWRIPADWLKTFQTEKKWVWSKTKNRLIVRHSESFCILDIPTKRNFKIQLEDEMQSYREYFSAITESKSQKSVKNLSPRKRFLENLFEFAERRLRQALNVETRDELNKILFEQTATAAVSATHLEITFSLSDLPLAVRFSGLDRNPGWIPAAGKYVEFHFV